MKFFFSKISLSRYLSVYGRLNTRSSITLSIVAGYKIPFTEERIQFQLSETAHFNLEQRNLLNQRVSGDKMAIQISQPLESQFLSNLFSGHEKDGGITQHFKMESILLLKDLVQTGDFLRKLDIKGCIFLLHNEQTVKEICPFPLERNSVSVLLNVLRSRSSSIHIFTKLLKIPIALLRRG